MTEQLPKFERVVCTNLLVRVLWQVVAGEERRDLESVEENLKVIDAIADRPWRTTFLSQRRTVCEDVFAGDVLDVDPHGRDVFNEVLTSDIFKGCPGHDRAKSKTVRR